MVSSISTFQHRNIPIVVCFETHLQSADCFQCYTCTCSGRTIASSSTNSCSCRRARSVLSFFCGRLGGWVLCMGSILFGQPSSCPILDKSHIGGIGQTDMGKIPRYFPSTPVVIIATSQIISSHGSDGMGYRNDPV